ncbi:LamG-like jellyroll fold domain-containing protein, partial [Sediminibacterium sp.]|uniref:LamG-like jellyroll fold domain-containing protein n=1 Tax=Sediminibacterium sp. TaxID=1917865 RepID=UPI003F72756F
MRKTTITFSAVCKMFVVLLLACTSIFRLQAQTYPFTTCGATGLNGPTQTQVNLAYASTPITLVTSNNGIQEWPVPATGLYSIKVAGAKGGGAGGGNGAVMAGEFLLNQGHVIQIVVGQRGTGGFGSQGSVNSGGGGGGSYVVNKTTGTILIIAGGGGGGNGDYGFSYPNTAGNPANTGTSGNSTYQTGGGVNGNGGRNGIIDDPAAGGGGYFTNGENSPGTTFATGGLSFLNGARGGAGRTGSYFGGDGGFGGGGGGTSNVLVRGGGGGGYSGGQGGTYQIAQTSVYTSNSDRGHGAGGGSINNGINQQIFATNASSGYVTVTALTTLAGALNFVKANNTYITVPHSASMNLGAEFTIEAWVNYTGVNSTIIDKGDYDYLLQVNCNNPGFAPNRLDFYNRNTGWVHSIGTVPEGVWTHVAVTLKNGTMTFYINGVASGTAAVNFAQDSGPVNIGRQSPWSCACNIFNGNMDELRVWNRALSACEINANKGCELSGTQTGLAAYYKFNQGSINVNNSSVNTLVDASGNNNTGTLTGFALTGTTSNWVAGQVSGTCATYTAPNASITGNLMVCAGATTQLSNTIAGGVWSSSNNAVATVSAGGLVTAIADGTTTITYTNNCGGVSTATVTVKAKPVAAITASGPTSFCAGGSVTLSGVQGATSSSLSFNGINNSVRIPDVNYAGVNSFTIEAWVKPNNITSNPYYEIARQQGAPNWIFSFQDYGTILSFGLNTTTGYAELDAPIIASSFTDGNWHHVAATYDGTNCRVYKDGVLIGTSNKTGNIVFASQYGLTTYIGAYSGGEYFNGLIDEVRFWNTTRTQAQLDANKLISLPVNTTGLTAYYKFDEGTGTTTNDASGNGNHGTLVNGTSWSTQSPLSSTGALTYLWSPGGATSSSITANAPGVYTLQVTGAGGCTSDPASITLTERPVPTVNPVTNKEVCHNGVAVPAINFSGSVSGTVYSWTNDNPSIGLPASGTGDIASFIGLNPGNTPAYANITVTPSYTTDGNTCTGTPVSFVIRVNPIPVFNAIANQSLCNGASSTAIHLTSAVAGTTFTWFNTTPSVNIGLPNGNGATIPSFTATNTTGQSVTANYLALSYYQGETMGCGTSRSFSYTVNPVPPATITAGGATTICAGGSVTLTASAGSSYVWNNNATTASITVNESGTYSVKVSNAEGCSANSSPITVTVNPLPAIPVISTSGSTAVCVGSPVTLTASGAVSGKAIDFDGVNDNIVVPNNAVFNFTSQYTAESWINVRSYQYGTIISKFEDDNNNRGWMVNIGETGAPTIHVVHSRLGTWTNPIQWNSGFQPVLNTWYHIAVVFDATLSSNHIKLYVNGTLTAQTSWPYTLTPNAANMYIGGYDGPGNGVNGGANERFFNGRLDEVRVWNVTRTASQISANYNQVMNAPVAGLVAAYAFNENSGTAIADITGMNNGTMVNNPTRITNGPLLSGAGNNTYLWSTGATGASITVNETGTYTVTATNENGCAATSAPVTITNYAMPTITCPGNITVASPANQCGANVTYSNAVVTAGPANPTVTYSHPSGSFFPVGNTTVTATVTDACGNTATCTFTVTVQDITAPVLACTNQSSSSPVNFMRGTSVGGTAAIVAWAGLNGASQYAGSSLGSSCNESWRPFGTLCDEAPNTNSMTTSTKTNGNSGITFNTGGANSIGAFVVDLGATQTFNLAQVYQMFSDGKTTHVRGFYHPSNATTAPSITDAGWVEMFPETLVGPGVLSGNNVTQPTEITFNSTSARYVRFYVRNDGRYGNGTWIETRSIKLFSTAPAVNNVIVTAADGECNAVATYNVQAIDNCSGTVVTYSIPSGSSFPIGTTPVQVTATDASGNTTTCSFSVIVNAPEINVTGSGNSIPTGTTTISAANNTNFGGTLPNTSVSKSFVVQNTGTAALKISSINLSGVDASAFSITGITLPATIAPNANANFNVVFNSNTPGIKNATVTIQNTDCNEAAYQFAITAEITCTDPVFVNQHPQVQTNTTTTTCNAVVNYPLSVNGIPTPGLNYTFSGATTGSGSGTGTGQTFNLGTTHVIVTAMNPCSTVVYEFDVIVSDITAPTAIAQNLSVNLNTNGTATITAAQVNNGSNDNCGIASIAIDKTSFNCSNVGANTVTLTVTDVNGNSSTATATVTIVDNTPPSITAPANIIIPAGTNCTATGINLGTPVTADNCAVQSITNNAPTVFASGITNITWIVTDASGNTATAIQRVTVVDQTAPVPVVATLPDITSECSVTVTEIPKATDNCNGQITATTTSPLIYSAQGTYTITWRYTDLAGNSSTQTQTVIVKDITPPVINCPAPITTTAPSNQCGVVVNYPQPTTSDNCGSGNAGLQTLTYGAQFFDYADNRLENQYSPGLPMTFAPTDGQKLAVFLVNCGSTHFMYQNVTLPSGGPITLGFDMKYTNHYSGGFSSNQFIAVELRNPVNNALIATLFKTNPGAPQSTGMIRYTYDLSAYAGQQVRLQIIDATINNFFIDVLLDNITLPGSSLVNGSFETGNYNGWTIGSSNTGCGTFGIGSGPSLSVVQKAGLPSGSTFPIGTTTNTFEVTDLAGNKSTCSFNVTVNAPEISISGNGNEIVTGDNTPSTSDNTDLGGTIPGNSISKTFVIANNGTSALTVSSININNAAFTRSGISLPTTIQPGQSASFTISFVSGTLGVQTAIVTVNNSDCNEGTYNFTVKAEVTCTNPVFTNANSLVEANTTTTSCNTIVQYPLAITGIPTPNLNYVFSGATTSTGNGTGSGNLFNKGTTHVIVTAVNPCSTVIHEFDIVVSDITPPITIAQNLTIHLNESGTANITPAQVNNGSSDNCSIATIALDKTAFDCSNVGANTVTLTVTDVNGNSSSATATIT